MRRVLWVAWPAVVLLMMAQAARAQGGDEAPSLSPLFVRASISTAGPYGESWYLTIGPDGDVSLQVFYTSKPSGSLMARFQLSAEQVGAIRKASETQRFFEVPGDLAPQQRQFHRPHLQLEFHLGERHHKVSLYDPSAIKSHAATGRFLMVWNTVFEGLPLRPSW